MFLPSCRHAIANVVVQKFLYKDRHSGLALHRMVFRGGYTSSWWFVLTQVLGYEDVKLYDGAAQEWVRYYDMVPYEWK